MKSVLLLALLFMISVHGHAQNIVLKTDKESGIYKSGETITAKAIVDEACPIEIKVWKNNRELILEKSIESAVGEFQIFEGTFDASCSIIVEASSGEIVTKTGAVVNPAGFTPGFKRPGDLDLFWDKQKKQLSELAFDVKLEPVELTEEDEGFECYDIEINCLGPKSVRGYFAKPKTAALKSLPIVIFVRAAGVKGDWCRSHVEEAMHNAKISNGVLSLDINAHGMLNGQPESYYENLEDGELHHYWDQGIENRDTYYFRDMYLRVLRSIEYMTRQPEWDGKRILMIGESQGGGQALAAASLDHRVSAVVATVPAMCDFGGTLHNRKGGWPQPLENHMEEAGVLETLPYFDTAQLLKGCKATLVVEIGLIDQTCPASSIYAAINQADGVKIFCPVPYREHQLPEDPQQRQLWEETILASKEAFIKEYLR